MRLLVVTGMEEHLAWSLVPKHMHELGIGLFCPLLECRGIVEEWLGIDNHEGDVRGLALEMRRIIEERTPGCFHRMFLRYIIDVRENGSDHAGNDISEVVVLYDDISAEQLIGLKHGQAHPMKLASFVDNSLNADIYCEKLLGTQDFMDFVVNHFGAKEVQGLPEEEPKELPAPELTIEVVEDA